MPALAALYIRVSDPRQAAEDKTSPQTQEAECRAAAAEDGLLVEARHLYVDTHTGEELFERPALTALRAAAARREFRAIYCLSLDRLSRDAIHQGIVIMELERLGISLHFVKEPLDDTPDGQLCASSKGMGRSWRTSAGASAPSAAWRPVPRSGVC